MTQSVLKNEVSHLVPRSDVDSEKLLEIAQSLGGVLADAFRINLNTQAIHWNAEGPLFFSLHKLTDERYQQISETIDSMAERMRALGLPAIESFAEITEQSKIGDLPRDASLQERVERLISDLEVAVKRTAKVAVLAEENGDVKTADLLTTQVGDYEEYAWMLRATIAS